MATSRADTDVSSAAHEAAKAAARATPRGEKPLERTIVWTVEFLKRSPLSTAAPKEAARQPMPRPMAAVAASLKRVWGLILCGVWKGRDEFFYCFFMSLSISRSRSLSLSLPPSLPPPPPLSLSLSLFYIFLPQKRLPAQLELGVGISASAHDERDRGAVAGEDDGISFSGSSRNSRNGGGRNAVGAAVEALGGRLEERRAPARVERRPAELEGDVVNILKVERLGGVVIGLVASVVD